MTLTSARSARAPRTLKARASAEAQAHSTGTQELGGVAANPGNEREKGEGGGLGEGRGEEVGGSAFLFPLPFSVFSVPPLLLLLLMPLLLCLPLRLSLPLLLSKEGRPGCHS